jgi:outer membrane lipoprotein-sorting protein
LELCGLFAEAGKVPAEAKQAIRPLKINYIQMKVKILMIVALVFVVSLLHAQEADEIIANYFENTGSIKNWKNLESMRITAVMNQGEMQLDITIFQKRDNLQRTEIQLQGKTIIQAYDGETGWMINPLTGSDAPQKLPADMVEEMKDQKFESDLLDYKEKGHTVELEGTEDIEGSETYKLKLTKANGDVEYYFFDTEYYVPIMQRRVVKFGPGKGQETETYISDYQEVGEFMMPFFIDARVNGQSMQKITFKEYFLNEEMDDSMFFMPESSDSSEE